MRQCMTNWGGASVFAGIVAWGLIWSGCTRADTETGDGEDDTATWLIDDTESLHNLGDGGALDSLDMERGCAGVYNPNQLLDLTITIDEADWQALLADTTNSVYFPGRIACNDESSIAVGIRRKPSKGTDKPGLKIDINEYDSQQEYHGLIKLSLENGIRADDGSATVTDVLREYMAWRLMVLSGAISSRAALVRVSINGETVVYTNVEQVDKPFLASRLNGHTDGWLFKQGNGYKTNENEPNPYAYIFCFWEEPPCAVAELESLQETLPRQLNLDQLLRMGAVNALVGNQSGLLFKDKNILFYDGHPNGRVYFPWDLDNAMAEGYHVVDGTGLSGQVPLYTDVLFAHWRDDYLDILRELLETRLSVAVIDDELDRAKAVAGTALEADPYLDGTIDEAIETLKNYWSGRHTDAATQIDDYESL